MFPSNYIDKMSTIPNLQLLQVWYIDILYKQLCPYIISSNISFRKCRFHLSWVNYDATVHQSKLLDQPFNIAKPEINIAIGSKHFFPFLGLYFFPIKDTVKAVLTEHRQDRVTCMTQKAHMQLLCNVEEQWVIWCNFSSVIMTVCPISITLMLITAISDWSYI